MGFLFFIFVLVALAFLYSRMRRTEDNLRQEIEARNRDNDLIVELTRRIWKLEQSQPLPMEAAIQQPPVEAPAPEPVALPAISVPAAVSVPEPAFGEPEPAKPSRTWRDRFRESMGGQEWEAVVGGNWLNKLGVLVLVIGIALLLGYEFTRVGPAGRVATGIAISLTMLACGVLAERRHGYAIFARGLIGGGWAVLYFTTYAMHAVPAAKIIDNAYVGTGLLLAVASAMIVHSLRYRSRTSLHSRHWR